MYFTLFVCLTSSYTSCIKVTYSLELDKSRYQSNLVHITLNCQTTFDLCITSIKCLEFIFSHHEYPAYVNGQKLVNIFLLNFCDHANLLQLLHVKKHFPVEFQFVPVLKFRISTWISKCYCIVSCKIFMSTQISISTKINAYLEYLCDMDGV